MWRSGQMCFVDFVVVCYSGSMRPDEQHGPCSSSRKQISSSSSSRAVVSLGVTSGWEGVGCQQQCVLLRASSLSSKHVTLLLTLPATPIHTQYKPAHPQPPAMYADRLQQTQPAAAIMLYTLSTSHYLTPPSLSCSTSPFPTSPPGMAAVMAPAPILPLLALACILPLLLLLALLTTTPASATPAGSASAAAADIHCRCCLCCCVCYPCICCVCCCVYFCVSCCCCQVQLHVVHPWCVS